MSQSRQPLIIRNHGGAYLSPAGYKFTKRLVEAQDARCAKCGAMVWIAQDLGGSELRCPKVRSHGTGWELDLKGEEPKLKKRV
jgi:hypothetical protein